MRTLPESDLPHAPSDAPAHAPAQDWTSSAALLEAKITEVGGQLLRTVRSVVTCATGSPDSSRARPQALARLLGLDKVLTSRILKAIRGADPIQAAHRMPGPDPLRRFVKAAGKKGAPQPVIDDALAAIDRFESLISAQVGDRSLLDAILSAWVPDARREFELRRKQSAFKAMSQLRGVQARTSVATVLLAPNPDGRTMDVVWLNGLVGVHRVRPGAIVKISTRRMTPLDSTRRPLTLSGLPIADLAGEQGARSLLIPEFSSDPTPSLSVRTLGQSIFYTLGGDGFGVRSSSDLMFAEVNRAELPRFVPKASGRKSYFFADVTIPTEVLQFDVLVHEDLYPGQAPELCIYDTSFEGSASPNDPARDMDRLDLLELIEPLGPSVARIRSSDIDHYPELLRHVVDKTSLDGTKLRGYRCRIDYPLYGSQITMIFRGVDDPG